MPSIQWPPAAGDLTDTIVLPKTGITVEMKKLADGPDKHEAMQAVLGEGFNSRHGYARYLRYMSALLIVSWDVTTPDEKGNAVPLPISPQTIKAAVTDESDYALLLEEAAKRTILREDAKPEEEANFETASSTSSAVTNSPTPESSEPISSS